MIPNDDKTIYATLTRGDTHTTLYRVIAWDGEGQPLVITARGLKPAARLHGYLGIRLLSPDQVLRYQVSGSPSRVQLPNGRGYTASRVVAATEHHKAPAGPQ